MSILDTALDTLTCKPLRALQAPKPALGRACVRVRARTLSSAFCSFISKALVSARSASAQSNASACLKPSTSFSHSSRVLRRHAHGHCVRKRAPADARRPEASPESRSVCGPRTCRAYLLVTMIFFNPDLWASKFAPVGLRCQPCLQRLHALALLPLHLLCQLLGSLFRAVSARAQLSAAQRQGCMPARPQACTRSTWTSAIHSAARCHAARRSCRCSTLREHTARAYQARVRIAACDPEASPGPELLMVPPHPPAASTPSCAAPPGDRK